MSLEADILAIRRHLGLTLSEAVVVASLLDGAEGTPEYLNKALAKIDGRPVRDAGTGKVLLCRARAKLLDVGLIIDRGKKGRAPVGATISPDMAKLIRAFAGTLPAEAA